MVGLVQSIDVRTLAEGVAVDYQVLLFVNLILPEHKEKGEK